MDIHERYLNLAREAADNYFGGTKRPEPNSEELDHVISVAAKVMMVRDSDYEGGSFANAVVRNDLGRTITSADTICAKYIPFFVHCRELWYVPNLDLAALIK